MGKSSAKAQPAPAAPDQGYGMAPATAATTAPKTLPFKAQTDPPAKFKAHPLGAATDPPPKEPEDTEKTAVKRRPRKKARVGPAVSKGLLTEY